MFMVVFMFGVTTNTGILMQLTIRAGGHVQMKPLKDRFFILPAAYLQHNRHILLVRQWGIGQKKSVSPAEAYLDRIGSVTSGESDLKIGGRNRLDIVIHKRDSCVPVGLHEKFQMRLHPYNQSPAIGTGNPGMVAVIAIFV
jgi:hypothetical protein